MSAESGTPWMETRVEMVLPDGTVVPLPPPTKVVVPNPEPEAVWSLIRECVPEVASGLIRILGMARKPGTRTVLAVFSNQPITPSFDAVGTFVGHRGERVKRMVHELGEEKIDVVLWDESVERFITNMLAPLRMVRISFDEATRQANVVVKRGPEDRFLDLALRSELLADLTGWKLNLAFADAAPPPP